MNEREFDVVILGAGPAGEVCAGRLGEAGLEVAITEPHLIGGECSFYACMPSKALLRPGELLAEVRRIPGVSEAVTGELDVQAVLKRRDEIIHGLDDSHMEPWLTQRGVAIVRQAGRLDGERRVQAGDETLVARKAVVVATGTDALIPPIDGLREEKPWTNREATTAEEVPERLVILGGGVVGVEMAQAYRSFGSQITLIEATDRLLAREEPFASEHVEQSLREAGVDIHLDVKAVGVRAGAGEVEVELEAGGPVRGDQLLVAIGRRVNTSDIGLESVGLEPGKPISVDDSMRANDWLYAIGDVNGRALLTHMGKYQARVAAVNILGGSRPADYSAIPRVVFTDPQVAAVGEPEGVATGTVQLAAVARTSTYTREYAEKPGFLTLVSDGSKLVGAYAVGPEAGEWLQQVTLAIRAQVSLDVLLDVIQPFPTFSEIVLWTLQALEKEISRAR